MIRAFVGLPVPPDVAIMLHGAQAGLPSGRPVPPENFHVTLAFLGEQPGPVLEDVHFELDTIRAPAFEVAIRGTGLFGGAKPTALYAAVAPSPGLSHLRDKVLQAARGAGLGLPYERFVPHVTLARFGQGLKGDAAAEMQDFVAARLSLSAGPYEAEEFILYRSRLGKPGASYEPMMRYALG
jgi:2'-5' RNA ligase